MILVTNLQKITRCPNCGNSNLDGLYNINTHKCSKYCAKCEEEIVEKERDFCVAGTEFGNEQELTMNEGVSAVTTTYATGAERLREISDETDREDIAEICEILADIFDRRHMEIMARLNR
jgi:hypothetical protein